MFMCYHSNYLEYLTVPKFWKHYLDTYYFIKWSQRSVKRGRGVLFAEKAILTVMHRVGARWREKGRSLHNYRLAGRHLGNRALRGKGERARTTRIHFAACSSSATSPAAFNTPIIGACAVRYV